MRGKAMAKRPNAGDVYNRTPENVAANMQGKRDAYTTARKALLKMLESGPDETSSMRIAELDRLAKEQGVIQ
jgi:hypothetical protein